MLVELTRPKKCQHVNSKFQVGWVGDRSNLNEVTSYNASLTSVTELSCNSIFVLVELTRRKKCQPVNSKFQVRWVGDLSNLNEVHNPTNST